MDEVEFGPRKIVTDSIRFHNLNPSKSTVSFLTLDIEQVVKRPSDGIWKISNEINRSKAIWFQDMPNYQDHFKVLEAVIPPIEKVARKIVTERKELEGDEKDGKN